MWAEVEAIRVHVDHLGGTEDIVFTLGKVRLCDDMPSVLGPNSSLVLRSRRLNV